MPTGGRRGAAEMRRGSIPKPWPPSVPMTHGLPSLRSLSNSKVRRMALASCGSLRLMASGIIFFFRPVSGLKSAGFIDRSVPL